MDKYQHRKTISQADLVSTSSHNLDISAVVSKEENKMKSTVQRGYLPEGQRSFLALNMINGYLHSPENKIIICKLINAVLKLYVANKPRDKSYYINKINEFAKNLYIKKEVDALLFENWDFPHLVNKVKLSPPLQILLAGVAKRSPQLYYLITHNVPAAITSFVKTVNRFNTVFYTKSHKGVVSYGLSNNEDWNCSNCKGQINFYVKLDYVVTNVAKILRKIIELFVIFCEVKNVEKLIVGFKTLSSSGIANRFIAGAKKSEVKFVEEQFLHYNQITIYFVKDADRNDMIEFMLELDDYLVWYLGETYADYNHQKVLKTDTETIVKPACKYVTFRE